MQAEPVQSPTLPVLLFALLAGTPMWAWYVIFAGWLVALWSTGVDRNALSLIFTFACFVTISSFTSRRRVQGTVLLLGAALPLLQVERPPPKSIRITTLDSVLLPADQRLKIVFPLYDWIPLRERCGLKTVQLVLWARDYENIEFVPRHARIVPDGVAPPLRQQLPEAIVEQHGGRRIARLHYEMEPDPGTGAIVVNIQSRNGIDPIEVMKGPEFNGKKLYPKAIYLRATGPRCRVVYHSSHTRRRSRLRSPKTANDGERPRVS